VDNGPEYISGKLLERAEKQGISIQHIIENIEEAQDFATQWLWTYNNDRPNMGIGGITPAQKLKMAA
jgi:putative transposase